MLIPLAIHSVLRCCNRRCWSPAWSVYCWAWRLRPCDALHMAIIIIIIIITFAAHALFCMTSTCVHFVTSLLVSVSCVRRLRCSLSPVHITLYATRLSKAILLSWVVRVITSLHMHDPTQLNCFDLSRRVMWSFLRPYSTRQDCFVLVLRRSEYFVILAYRLAYV